MKSLLLLICSIATGLVTSAQFVAKMEVKEPIPGICNSKQVYVMFPTFKGQEEAVVPISKEEILERLNKEVTFLYDKADYSDKGMIGLIINCNSELVQCKMDNKTQDPELDKQIEAVFNSLGTWKAGKLNGKKVDTSKLFSFQIKNGRFIWG